jgi:DNA-binding FadR family transcriptional regulator
VEREGLRPGERIGTEHELAREFGVSRPTLREGLRRLAGSHLIRVQKEHIEYMAGVLRAVEADRSASRARLLRSDGHASAG